VLLEREGEKNANPSLVGNPVCLNINYSMVGQQLFWEKGRGIMQIGKGGGGRNGLGFNCITKKVLPY